MGSYHKENQEARKESEKAYEKAYDLVLESLRYARQCKGEDVDPTVKELASTVAKEAAEARKQAKVLAAKAAEARRIACKRALGKTIVPDFPAMSFNGGKIPSPPNRKK